MLLICLMGLVVLTVAFLPSVLYAVWIRNTEKYEREPWVPVAITFILGAVAGVVIALILEVLASVVYATYSPGVVRQYEFLARNREALDALVMACIVAPFAEEFSKFLCMLPARRYIDELEDGLVYGAAAGLGFAATENLLYEGYTLLAGGIIAWIVISVIRSITGGMLHGSTTALMGYGYSRKKLERRRWALLGGYLVAVAIHGLFNLVASLFLFVSEDNPVAYLLILLVAIAMAVSIFTYVRRKIKRLDIQAISPQ